MSLPNAGSSQAEEAMATFDCAVCHDDSLPKDGVYPIPNTELFVCTDCLRGMKQRFEQHLNFEHTYPETWGQIILRPHDFPVFTQDLLDKYAKKEVEYSIQVRERLYCQYYYLSGVSPIHFLPLDDTDTQDSLRTQCDSFLGRKQAEKFRVRCGKCQGPSCTKCGDPLQPEVPLNAHSCAQVPDDVPEAFRGLERGRKFQLCPGCKTLVELKSGCNHITCASRACGTQFCYICGVAALNDSGHWDLGQSCPRYNHPDDDLAGYDQLAGDTDDDDNDEEEVADDAQAEEGAGEDFQALLNLAEENLTVQIAIYREALLADNISATSRATFSDLIDLHIIQRFFAISRAEWRAPDGSIIAARRDLLFLRLVTLLIASITRQLMVMTLPPNEGERHLAEALDRNYWAIDDIMRNPHFGVGDPWP